MSKKDNINLKIRLSIVFWIIGSTAVIGFVRTFSTAMWTDWFAVIFVFVWGGIILWFYHQI